jgi:hypothetical protein
LIVLGFYKSILRDVYVSRDFLATDQIVLFFLETALRDRGIHKVLRVFSQFGNQRKRSFFGLHRIETALARGSFSKKVRTRPWIATLLLVVFREWAKAEDVFLDLGGPWLIIKYTPAVTAVRLNRGKVCHRLCVGHDRVQVLTAIGNRAKRVVIDVAVAQT